MGQEQNTVDRTERDRAERIRMAERRSVHESDGRDSRDIKHDIDRTRSAMDDTLDELGERLNPRNLLDDIIHVFQSPRTQGTAKRAGNAAGDFATNLSRQVRENPVGATLVGAGLAWLAFGSSGSDRPQSTRSRWEDADEFGPAPRDEYEARYYEDQYDDDPEFYSEEDLILGRTYNPDDNGAEIIVPESYSDNQESGDGAAGKVKGAAAKTGAKADSTWKSAKSTVGDATSAVADAASSAGETISDAASSAVGGVKSVASKAAGAASSAGESTSRAGRGAYRRGRSASRDAYRGTARYGRRSRRQLGRASRSTGNQMADAYEMTSERVQQAHRDAPLALGLGVLALGALAGAVIPRTRREDEWMGEASDEAISEARRSGQEFYNTTKQRGQEAVQNTVETAKGSAESQGLTADSLADRATRAVESATESIAEAAREEGLHPRQLKDDARAVADDTSKQAKTEAQKASGDAETKVRRADSDADKAL